MATGAGYGGSTHGLWFGIVMAIDGLLPLPLRPERRRRFLPCRTREAETLRAGLERAQGVLTKAQRLISQLGGEQERWQNQAMSLSEALSTLPLEMLLAAGFATYLVRYDMDVKCAHCEYAFKGIWLCKRDDAGIRWDPPLSSQGANCSTAILQSGSTQPRL